ncbi:ATP-binding protein [Rhizobium sp.]|uniref:ATP-binding protein n=1 Tax=Rhizobium sp. TaxID=391 RepID=UPI0039184B80
MSRSLSVRRSALSRIGFERKRAPAGRPPCSGLQGYEEGLGLGLFIAREIAKAHNGSLTVESSSEETTFTFTMPTDPD